jgi:hypothetical protein
VRNFDIWRKDAKDKVLILFVTNLQHFYIKIVLIKLSKN